MTWLVVVLTSFGNDTGRPNSRRVKCETSATTSKRPGQCKAVLVRENLMKVIYLQIELFPRTNLSDMYLWRISDAPLMIDLICM